MDLAPLLAAAGSRHGVLTVDQARNAGLSADQVYHLTTRRVLDRVAPTVYRVHGYPQTRAAQLAIAAATYRGAISHQTAADLWGMLDRRTDDIHVITGHWERLRRQHLAVHESRDLIDTDIVTRQGIPVTTPVRTLVDLGAEVAPQAVAIAFDTGVRLGLFTVDDVAALVRRVAKKGRRGVGPLRPLIAERRRWEAITESALEDRFRRVLLDWGLPAPVPQFVLEDATGRFVCRADFAYPDHRVVIELDSERHHMDRTTFRSDRAKQNRATINGWTTLRYTWWDLSTRPHDVCAEIAALLPA